MWSSTSHSSTTSRRPSQDEGGGGSHGDEGGGGGGGGGGGKLVKVAFARNQIEAEMIQGLLLESDIASVLKRSRGFDNPDFLAAGPHDVLVSSSHARAARELLADTVLESEDEERAELLGEERRERGGDETSARRLALWVGVAFVAAVIIVWALYQLS